jgi:hypothetical protein
MLELAQCIYTVIRFSYDDLPGQHIHNGLAKIYRISTNHTTENLVSSYC